MRWLKAGLLSLLLTLLLTPLSVLADSSEDVTVTATGYVCGIPGDLTLTYISDFELGISFNKGEDAVNTMVRVKYGSYPESRTDGYLVYYGEESSCTDPNIDLTSSQMPFYRAWHQNEGGVWEERGIVEEADFMSASFLFIGFILIAGLLTWFAIRVNLMLFRLAGAMSWLGLGIWLLLSDSTNLQMSDTWTQVIGLVFIVMCIGVLSLQMKADIRHEASVRGPLGSVGFPGARSESYSTWGTKPKKRKETTLERQAAYRERIRYKGPRR